MSLERPPSVEVDIDGLPEPDPAADGQAFTDEVGQPLPGGDEIPEHQRGAEKEEADEQGHAPFPEKLGEVALRDPRPVAEVMLDGFSDQSVRHGALRLSEDGLDL